MKQRFCLTKQNGGSFAASRGKNGSHKVWREDYIFFLLSLPLAAPAGVGRGVPAVKREGGGGG